MDLKDLGVYNPHYLGSHAFFKGGIEYREHLFNRSLPSDEVVFEQAVKARFPHCKIVATSYDSRSKTLGIATVLKRVN